jgi:hypothetical protein
MQYNGNEMKDTKAIKLEMHGIRSFHSMTKERLGKKSLLDHFQNTVQLHKTCGVMREINEDHSPCFDKCCLELSPLRQ